MRSSFWEVLERSRTGLHIKESDFDLSVFNKTQELLKGKHIKYDPENPILHDNSMVDEVFESALEFYVDVGTYCVSTGRIIKFTEEEIREELNSVPSRVRVGEGKDAVEMPHRSLEDAAEPIVCAGIQTVLFSDEEIMRKVYELCAQDRCVDGLWTGLVPSVENRYEVIAGTPSEIYPYRKATEILRKAIATVGRPGMFIISNAPSSFATIALADREVGMRPSDPFTCTGVSEMKISYDDLNRVAFGLAYGASIHASHSSMIGGFSGPPEGAAIVTAAGGLQSIMVCKADSSRLGIVHLMVKSRQTRDCLWAASIALQAFARNTSAITDGSIGDHPAAGPGTAQYFYEAAAGHIASTVSGAHSLEGTRKFVIGKTPNYGTPLESRWMGETCKASAGTSLAQANEIAKYLLGRYEANLKTAPAGQTFEQLYDLDTLKPKPEYEKTYIATKDELRNMLPKL